MSDMFEYLEAVAREDDTPFRNSAAISIDRAERKYASFLSAAQGDKEFESRISLVRDDIEKIAASTCEEYGYDDANHIVSLVLGQLEMLSARNSDSSKTDSIGDAKKQDLKSQDPDGYYTDPSPELNPGSSGDHQKNTNPPIPELKPDASQHPDDFEYPWDSALPSANLVDADKPMQPEDHHGDSTMTFPNKGQADPVTSSKKKSETLNPDNSVDLEGYHSVMRQIKEMFGMGKSVPDVMRQFGNQLRSWNVGEGDLRKVMRDAQHEQNLNTVQNFNFVKDFFPISSIKEAAENMNFNAFSENMTPSEAVEELVNSGMPHHEAKDRIDFYVNHINPGWAHKQWTSANENVDVQRMQEEVMALKSQAYEANMSGDNQKANELYQKAAEIQNSIDNASSAEQMVENQPEVVDPRAANPDTELRQDVRQPQNPQEELIMRMAQSQFEVRKRKAIQQYKEQLLSPASGLSKSEIRSLSDLDFVGKLDPAIEKELGYDQEGVGVIGIMTDPNDPDGLPVPYIVDPFHSKQYKQWLRERDVIRSQPKGVSIGDKAIQNKSLGLPSDKGPGPYGGPTGL